MTLFEMTEEQMEKLMDNMKPVPYLVIGGQPPRSPQENANAAWERLGKEMGFKHMTVAPAQSKGQRFFYAEKVSSDKS
jgi:predicted TIM-barrel fold metal-dependent hydrolase